MDLGCPRQQNKMEENPRSLNLDKYRISFKSYTSEYQNQPSGSTSIGAIASSTVGLSENEPQPGNDRRGKGWTKCSVKSAMSYILDLKPSGTSILSATPRFPLLQETLYLEVAVLGSHPA
uniref:Uncharacterized protein n=1 Tax=Knipowitschia caucasica TaxID=637954 RepID=A0AAV2LMV5_KNICA